MPEELFISYHDFVQYLRNRPHFYLTLFLLKIHFYNRVKQLVESKLKGIQKIWNSIQSKVTYKKKQTSLYYLKNSTKREEIHFNQGVII